jgi:2-hydroxychromene-2-carboxylate isomerase
MATLELYFDLRSPYTYMATTQIAGVAARTGSEVTYTPFRILELMKLVGNRPTNIESLNKNHYGKIDLKRWAARYRVPFNPHPQLRDFDYAELDRGAIVASEQGRAQQYVHGVMRAIFGEPVDLTDRAALIALLDDLGLEGAELLETAAGPKYVVQLERNAHAAADRGAFGSPTFFVGEQMFFGNDRLDFVEQALREVLS